MHVLKLRVCGYGHGRVEHIRHLALPVQALKGFSKDPCTADTSFPSHVFIDRSDQSCPVTEGPSVSESSAMSAAFHEALAVPVQALEILSKGACTIGTSIIPVY